MEAYLYAMGMTLCSLGITLHIIPFQFLRQKIGMQARIGTCGLVYKKVTGTDYIKIYHQLLYDHQSVMKVVNQKT